MKLFAARTPLFFALAFLACAMTACKTTPETEMSTVIATAGHARYRDGKSERWHDVKLGSFIPQGAVIQTDDGLTNAVKLKIGRRIQFLASPYHPDLDVAYHLTLYGNSVLKLDRVTTKDVSGKKIFDIRLVLSMGYVDCDIGRILSFDDVFPPPRVTVPKLETIKAQPGKSYFEIRSGNVVVHAEQAQLAFSPEKAVSLLSGVAALEFTDTGVTKDLFAYQRYNFVTGEVSELDFSSDAETTTDYRWHYLRTETVGDGPRFQIPQRPF